MDYLLNWKNLGEKENCFLVLNLIINGLPSKLSSHESWYKISFMWVLNLIINGLPSKQILGIHCSGFQGIVLNLIINGLPSKH